MSVETVTFEGLLLDVDYITQGDDNGKRAVIRLWCKNKSGETFIILDENFKPYFYAVPSSLSADREHIDYDEEIRSIMSICIHREEEIKPERVIVEKKKIIGKEKQVLKIFARYPKHVPLLREEIRRMGFEVFEADIPFSYRYLIDNQLTPFEMIKARGKPDSFHGIASIRVEGKIEHKKCPDSDLPPLKIMAFDCEMANQYGMPSPKRDPIIIISVAVDVGRERKIKLFIKGDEEDDDRIIRDFLGFIKAVDPDIIVGYNSDAFDWQYIRERAKIHGIKLDVGRADQTEVQISPRGAKGLPDVNITGRLNVDLYRVARRDLSEVNVKTLENVADVLGIKRERVDLSPKEIYDAWSSGDRCLKEKLFDYAKDDVISTIEIAERILPFQYELSRLVRRPLDEVVKMGRGQQVEAFISSKAFLRNELIPPKKEDSTSYYEGGFVLSPKKGLHENVVYLDFTSMYPNIMINFNISPDTLVDPADETDDVYIAPEVLHSFRKKPDGFFKSILKELLEKREKIKEEMKKYDKKSDIYRILQIQQQCLKILSNSFYGYTGWRGARFYKKECAEATTAWGRFFLKKAKEKAEKLGLEVIYSDTDSLFVKIRDKNAENIKQKTLEAAKRLSEEISREMPLELEIEAFFKLIFFTEKKKRYAAIDENNEIIVRGLEVRRGDWCELAREVQSKIIELVLMERSPEKALNYTKKVIKDVKEGKIPLEKFLIYKTLTKKISDYESKQAHVVAAKKARARSIYYETGSKIPYVIIKGEEKTSDRAFPYDLIDKKEGNEIISDNKSMMIDYTYYIEHQIIPAAMRILSHFDYDTSDLMEEKQRTLDYWFR